MKRTIPLFLMMLITLLLTGCGLQNTGSGVRVWLDVPLSGASLAAPKPLKIEGHASSLADVARIEISINGSVWQVIDDPSCQNNLCSFNAVWQPDQPGVYTIQVVAIDANGEASSPDEATLTIGATEPPVSSSQPFTATPSFTPEISVTPSITPTHTPTTRPEPLIQFWADPASIAAGKCTNIRWSASNVSRIAFGGVEQPFSGSDSECPCADRTYTLVVTLLDGTIVERSASVAVSGSCATEVPADTTPPPVPVPQVPSDGLSIACKASQSLTWLPVTDPSKIKEYQVRIQHSSDNVHWTDISSSPITGLTDKTTTIGVECGWYYRWSVRAIDGAGNISAWSGWSDFVINLS